MQRTSFKWTWNVSLVVQLSFDKCVSSWISSLANVYRYRYPISMLTKGTYCHMLTSTCAGKCVRSITGIVCTLAIKKYQAFAQITVSPIQISHGAIDCIFHCIGYRVLSYWIRLLLILAAVDPSHQLHKDISHRLVSSFSEICLTNAIRKRIERDWLWNCFTHTLQTIERFSQFNRFVIEPLYRSNARLYHIR